MNDCRRGKILFRVDGGNVWGIAYGHIKRCLLLANALRSRGEIIFVMKNYPEGVALVREQGFAVETILTDDDSDATLGKFLHDLRPRTLIIDLAACPYMAAFDDAAQLGIRTIVFDIKGQCAGKPDVIINDSIVEEFTSRLIRKAHRCLLGPEYFVMDKPRPAPPLRDTVRKVMITMGGADPAGLTVKVLAALLPGAEELDITAVLGPSFTGDATVERIAGGSRVKIMRNPADFIGLMAEQDVVISAGGRTLYECAHLGRPTIVVPSIEHEAVTADAFACRVGFPTAGMWDDSSSPGRVLEALKMFRGSGELRRLVHSKGKTLVDGKGLQRILEEIGRH